MAFLLEEHHCPVCFIEYAAPARMFAEKRKDGSSFYCPNGHSLSYRDNENDRIRRERDQLKQRMAQKEAEIAAARELRQAAERQAAAARGQVTKLKKRAGAGVCPCCNRTFLSLQRHMQQKHPEFAAEDVSNVVPIKRPT